MPQNPIMLLKHRLESVMYRTNVLKSQSKQHRLEGSNQFHIAGSRKDDVMENMSPELNGLESQVDVKKKLDALAGLETIDGRELALSFKGNQMDVDAQHFNNSIENLTNNLNKTVIKLMAVRQELITATAQFDADVGEKAERLRVAESKVQKLFQMNEMLKIQNTEYVYKLEDQLNESGKVMEDYENDLKAKTALAELYKGKSVDCQAQNDEVFAAVTELQKLLNDYVRLRETELNESELHRKAELGAKDEIITKLTQELKDSNCMLKAYGRDDDDNIESDREKDSALIHVFPLTNHHSLKTGMTFTEMYTQYCRAVEELQNNEQENNCVTTSTTNVCHKSVGTEADLSIDGNLYSRDIPYTSQSEKENLLKIKELTQDNIKLRHGLWELSAEKTVLLAEANLSNVQNSSRIQKIQTLEQQNQKYASMITEHKVANRCLIEENAKLLTELSVAGSRFENLQNDHRLLSDMKKCLVVELETLKQEVASEKVSNKMLKDDLEMLLHRPNLLREMKRCRVVIAALPSKIVTNTVLTDTEIEDHQQSIPEFDISNTTMEDLSQLKKNKCLQTLQLVKSEPHTVVAESLQQTSSLEVNGLKRSVSEQNTSGSSLVSSSNYFKKLRSSKRARVRFIGSPKDYDEDGIINICDDDDVCNLQFISEDLKRQQTQLMYDTFRG